MISKELNKKIAILKEKEEKIYIKALADMVKISKQIKKLEEIKRQWKK